MTENRSHSPPVGLLIFEIPIGVYVSWNCNPPVARRSEYANGAKSVIQLFDKLCLIDEEGLIREPSLKYVSGSHVTQGLLKFRYRLLGKDHIVVSLA